MPSFDPMRPQRREILDHPLEAEIAALKAAQEWVPVSERLPEQIGACLVCRIDSHGFREIAWAFFNSSQRFADTNSLHAAVTHWMPLPRQPEAEGHTT